MARYIGSICKICRKLNFSVCGSDRCALSRRNTPPGMHPNLRRKMSDYKKRLLEKQKLRFSYWVSEKQFRNYVKEAFKNRESRAKHSSVFLNADWTMSFIALGLLPLFWPQDSWLFTDTSW